MGFFSTPLPLVICSEVPNNSGGWITNSAEAIAVGVIRANRLPTPLVWIEHWPKESTDRGAEMFELVVFSSKNVLAFPLLRPRMPERTLTP